MVFVDWLTVWSDDISLRSLIGGSTADGGKRKRSFHIARPDTVMVMTSPNRQIREPEPTGDQAETDIDARHYEGLRRTVGQQPVYQSLVKQENPATRTDNQTVSGETDTGARLYEGLGPTVGQQPVYQTLVKEENSAART